MMRFYRISGLLTAAVLTLSLAENATPTASPDVNRQSALLTLSCAGNAAPTASPDVNRQSALLTLSLTGNAVSTEPLGVSRQSEMLTLSLAENAASTESPAADANAPCAHGNDSFSAPCPNGNILPASAAVYRHETDRKLIALTFDDGPHYKYTAEILDILDEYGAKATFFTVGQLAERYPELILRELSEGHEVGNHTWSHPKMRKLTPAALKTELLKTEELLNEIADYRPKLFRPPEGSFSDLSEKVAEDNDYEMILWTVDTRDWAHTPIDDIVKNVLTNTRPGSIILCHDFIGRDSPTPDALRKFIPALIDEGYEFVTVSELLTS